MAEVDQIAGEVNGIVKMLLSFRRCLVRLGIEQRNMGVADLTSHDYGD